MRHNAGHSSLQSTRTLDSGIVDVVHIPTYLLGSDAMKIKDLNFVRTGTCFTCRTFFVPFLSPNESKSLD